MNAITRHFATLGDGRQVHYRRAGKGPAVLLLHQSPASSAELLPLIAELADEWTVFAPDTPGNGLSDPLALPTPSMEDFADAHVALLDVLGIESAAFYGFHTGAACVLCLAQRHPRRVALAIANGYTQFTPDQLSDILAHYLPPLRPDAYGAHLLWAWARIREQYLFFPWYRRSAGSRLHTGLPAPGKLHAGVMDLLRAGDAYRQAYRAAFLYDRAAAVQALLVPTVIMTARTDALYQHLDAMPTPAPCVEVHRPANYAEARQILRAALAAHRLAAPAPARVAARPVAERIWCDILQVDGLSLLARRSTSGSGRPIVFCHGTTGSSQCLEPLMAALLGTRPLLAIDLPGNGESDAPCNPPYSVAQQAEWLAHAIRAAGYAEVDAYGQDGGELVAIELARREPTLVHCIVTPPQRAVRDRAEHAAMLECIEHACTLDAHGTYLMHAWYAVRADGSGAELLDAASLHVRVMDLLRCRERATALHAMHANYPRPAAAQLLPCPLVQLDPATGTAPLPVLVAALLSAFNGPSAA